MRIVDVTSFFSDTCGGIKTYYRNKARVMPGRGVECHFVVPGKKRQEEVFYGGTLHRIPGPPIPGNRHYRLFGDIGGLLRLLRGLRPDVIEVGSHYLLPSLVNRAIRALGGTPPAVVGFLHSDIVGTLVEPLLGRLPGRRSIIEQGWRWVRYCHRRYLRTLVASHTVRKALEARGMRGVEWVGLGVDTELFRPLARKSKRSRPRILYCGRLSQDKECALLWQAFDSVSAATDAELVIVGDGPQRRKVEAFAQKRKGKVTLLGYFDHPSDVAEMLADADLAIVPGRRETFSLATAEALACGVPVVVPNRGAAQELVLSSNSGALFAAGDAHDLAEQIVAMLRLTPSERGAMAKRGRAFIERDYAWPQVMERLHQAYTQLAF